MQTLIELLRNGSELNHTQVEAAVAALVSSEAPVQTKADFLQALREKGESVAEIAAFVQSLLLRAVDPGIDPARVPGPMLDVCGTGGDRLGLFNISTTSMFILSAGGACVVKHGNRAVTSQCGGADVLEELGVRIDCPPQVLRACVESHGLGFFFAPVYHPAFKAIAPVRKALAEKGIPTIFNLLGPLLNPARPAFQLVGIFAPEQLEKYASILAAIGRTRAWAVHGGGMDEISLCGPSDVREIAAGKVSVQTLDPRDFGLELCAIDALRGGDRQRNAALLNGILDGSETGPRRDIVLLNAAAGFFITGIVETLAAGIALARRQIDSGAALAKLDALRSATAAS